MNEKILPDDNNNTSLEELTDEANKILETLEKEKDLENSIENYQKLIKLNNIIEKKFQRKYKEIREQTKKKIREMNLKKNEK